jgi:hypothetical protein
MESTNPLAASRPTAKRRFRFSLAALLFAMLCFAGLLAGLRIGIERLRLSPDPLQMTIIQRKTQDIPGLRGQAAIRLGDITDGQVSLSVHNDANLLVANPRSVRQGDVVPFRLGGQTFYIRVLRLHNSLVGDDCGDLEVSSKNPTP